MGNEPTSSRPVETEFLRAFLVSQNSQEFVENSKAVFRMYLLSLQERLGVEGQPLTLVPVDSFSDLSKERRLIYPLSELDIKRGVQYILRSAIEDVILDPLSGPFYAVTWEMLSAQTLMTVPRGRIPMNVNGYFLGGILAAATLFSGGGSNSTTGKRYLDNLYSTARGLVEDVKSKLQVPEPFAQYDVWKDEGDRLQFYIGTAYQMAYDSLSLWAGSVMRTVFGLTSSESSILEETRKFLLKDPEKRVPEFHKRAAEMAVTLGDELGRNIAEVAADATQYLLYVEGFPRPDEDINWRMFR
jgi:hypothetical protein